MDPHEPLFAALRECGLYTPDQLAALPAAGGGDPAAVADRLLAAKLLTPYQSRKVRAGRAAELLIGPYLVLDKIGEGGMGKVFRAVRRGTGKEVALKVIRAHLMANKVVRGRYHREAAASAALNHPNIVALLDADEADGRYYLAMEFVHGSDLARLVREFGPLPYPEAAEYVRQAALGLQHAHERGLVHRDVKPSNLLVSGERALPGTGGKATVRILDMGLVRTLADDDSGRTELTQDGTVVGTPDYMAPEQAKNSSTVDARADLYSLGCTFHFLLTGQPPYPDGTPIDKLLRHQLDPPPDLLGRVEDLPIGLAAVIQKLLAKKPADRFPSAAALAAALAPYTPDGIAVRRPGPPADRSRKPIPDVTPALAMRFSEGTRPVRPLDPTGGPEADTPPPVPRPSVPSVTVRAVGSGTRPHPPAPPGSEPLDAEPLDAEPLDAEPVSGKDVPAEPVRKTSTRLRRRKPTRPAGPGPAKLMAFGVGGVAAAVMLALGIYALVRPGGKDPPLNLEPGAPAPAVKPPPKADGPPPAGVNLPDGAAAGVVLHPREFAGKAAARDGSRLAAALDRLAADYGFDPRRCDRVTVGVLPGRPARYVAVGESRPAPADWAASRERAGAKPVGGDGPRLLAFPAAGGPVYGAAAADRGVILGTDQGGVASVARRAAGRTAPTGIAADVLAELQAAGDPVLPAVTFAADGRFDVPGIGALADRGVEAAAARAWVREGAFDVEVILAGRNKEKLTDFARTVLGARLPEKYPAVKPFVAPLVRQEGWTFETRDGRLRLRLSGLWDLDAFHTWVEALLPAGP